MRMSITAAVVLCCVASSAMSEELMIPLAATAQPSPADKLTDDQRQQMERWKIVQDLQSRIFEVTHDVTVAKAKDEGKLRGQAARSLF